MRSSQVIIKLGAAGAAIGVVGIAVLCQDTKRLHRIQEKIQIAQVLANHPDVIPSYLRSRVTGEYIQRRYENLWREVRDTKPRKILEIGVAYGDTAVRLIEEAVQLVPEVEYWGFDLFEEGMTPYLKSEEASRTIMPLSLDQIAAKIQRPRTTVHLVSGDTKETLANTNIGTVDLAFIDGGHSYTTVAADWANVQRYLHDASVVYFDDYTDTDAEMHEGYGVRRLVDEIDRSTWKVEILLPKDKFVREWGCLETQFARVTRR